MKYVQLEHTRSKNHRVKIVQMEKHPTKLLLIQTIVNVKLVDMMTHVTTAQKDFTLMNVNLHTAKDVKSVVIKILKVKLIVCLVVMVNRR